MEKEKQYIVKELDEESGVFKGYLSTYDNVDRDGDIIRKGAFDNSLKQKSVVPLCFNHLREKVIGKLELSTDDKGLLSKGTFNLKDPLASNVYELLKMGALDSMSIGMRVKDYEPIDKGRPFGGWDIKEVDVWEGSIVTVPANEQATINQVKEQSKQQEKEKRVNGILKMLDDAEKILRGDE